MTEQGDILFDVRDGIGRVTFNRPQARNAFTFQMYERARRDLRGSEQGSWHQGADLHRRGRQGVRRRDGHQTVPRLQDAAGRDRVRGAGRPRARRAGKLPRPDHRGDRRRLHRRRRRHRGLLRSAHRHQDRQIRFPDRAHARQLPVDGELQPARGAARTRAREGHHLHGASGRGAGSARPRPAQRSASRMSTALKQRADELAKLLANHAPLTLRATKEAMRRLQPRLSAEEGHDLILMCYMSKDFREGLDAFLTKRPPQWSGE